MKKFITVAVWCVAAVAGGSNSALCISKDPGNKSQVEKALEGKVPVAAKHVVRLGSKNLVNPVPISRPEPEYPKDCLDPKNPCHRAEGKVFLLSVIRTNGRVETLKVIARRPKGPAGKVFVKEAVYHIYEKWKFKPGTLKGEPVDVVTGIEVLFNPR